ncbi:phospholipase D-like domain-containing protein [Nitrosophilus alvini]|uniref:phospholipase D-like domain-containing protein n=1 Tax=Nitrosophilus alvini TaxID=2714855 RepID=UPI00190A1B5C|nr:phospholipase D-like domain-containing protein [Nitrosophilus alvini]
MNIKIANILFLIMMTLTLNAQEGTLYVMPKESKEALSALLDSIDKAKSKIDVAIYSFTHKKIAKRLKNAAKRGVKVRIIFDKKSNINYKRSQLRYLAKYSNIDIYLINGKRFKNRKYFGKMHMKLAIIDNRRLIFGSANWSNSGFGKNYELLYIIDSYHMAKKAGNYYEQMIREAERY